jgi:hypothetical protein
MSLPTNPEAFAHFIRDSLTQMYVGRPSLFVESLLVGRIIESRIMLMMRRSLESDPVYTWRDESQKTAPSDSESEKTGTDIPVKEVTFVLRRGCMLSEPSLFSTDPSNSLVDSDTISSLSTTSVENSRSNRSSSKSGQ